MVGSSEVEFLFDSGSPVTTIPVSAYIKIKKDWELGNVKIFGWTKNGSRVLKGYGSKKPLNVLCSLKTKITVKGADKPPRVEEIFVVHDISQALLGKEAAEHMKLLKIGLSVNKLSAGEMKMVGAKSERFPSIPNFQLSFDIDESVTPRKDFRYNIPQSLEASLNENLDSLTNLGIIEPASTTPTWVSRLKAVVKADGAVRWVVTMLGPNKAIRRVYYPMPSTDKLTVKMRGAKRFTKLDIKKAFHHVELDERSREMTTFMTSKGPMRFTRLAFGVNCAPEAFQKIMEDILRGCDGAVVFIDDFLVFGGTTEQLELRTNDVLARLKANNLTLNPEKCEYNKEEVEFLGFRVDSEGFIPTEDKIRDVQACERPKSVSEMKSFLGLVNFMTSFIPDLSEISEPLRRLSGTNCEFEWTDEQEEAFTRVKNTVAENVFKRGFFDENDEIWLYTDASPVGLGAVMVQTKELENGEKETRPIAFASKALTEAERRYPQTQREALAVVWGVEKFHFYLIGREFNLVVDHQPLAFIFSDDSRVNKRATTRAESWAMRLQTYRFKVVVIRSEDNIADYLSRESLHNLEPFEEGSDEYELGTLTVFQKKSLKTRSFI